MPDFRTLIVETDGPVARLVLNRPERLNALSRETLRELPAAAAWLDGERDVRVVVVSGAGRGFSAGFDLGDIQLGADRATLRDSADLGRRMAEAVTGMRALTIAAVHGHCVGGGLVLAASCDLRLAAAGARFSIPEVDLGIPLGWGGVQRLVREIGPAATKELVLTCRPFDAAEAHALRFVNRVVEDDALSEEADALARELAAKSAMTLEVTKQQVNAAAEAVAGTAGAVLDAELLAAAFDDPESREAGRRYLASRGR